MAIENPKILSRIVNPNLLRSYSPWFEFGSYDPVDISYMHKDIAFTHLFPNPTSVKLGI